VNLIVVGCGSVGRRHARNLAALTAGDGSVFVHDIDVAAVEAVVAETGATPLAHIDDLRLHGIRGAIVALPNHLHVPVARQLLEQDVSVLVEKPISHTLEGVDEAIALARSRRLVLMTGYNLRHHPNLVQAKRLLDEGAIGRPISGRFYFGYNLALWRPGTDYRLNYGAIAAQGGGVILDVTHEIDLVTWLLGDVAEVACLAGTLTDLDVDTEDVAALLLRMTSGAIVELHLDYADLAYERGFRLVGTGGTLAWDMPSATLAAYRATAGEWETSSVELDFNETYIGELRHFLDAIRGEATAYDDGTQARRTLAVALAAKQSARDRVFVPL
jgi:predicted dehydrogenase